MPAKADPGEQAEFLTGELRPRPDQAERGRRTVLFVGAAPFVCGPFLGHVWCLVRLFVPGPSGRKRCNVLAAPNAVTREVTRVTDHGYINALSVCELLAKVAAAGLPGEVTLVMDDARYRRCELAKGEARRLGVELPFLPGYSPNLDLTERLWGFVKKEVLGARSLDTDDAFTHPIDGCLGQLPTKHKSKMDTLLTLDFQLFDDVPMLPA